MYEELQKVTFLNNEFCTLINQGRAGVIKIVYGSDEYKDYLRLINNPDPGMKIIGKGEAAAIALLKIKME